MLRTILIFFVKESFFKYKIEVPLDFAKKVTLEEIFKVLDDICDTGIKLGTRYNKAILSIVFHEKNDNLWCYNLPFFLMR